MFDQCDDPPNLLCQQNKHRALKTVLNKTNLDKKERVASYKNSKIHNFAEIMSLVKTGSIKKSKAWKGIFQDKNTPKIEKPISKKIPSTEKCTVAIR